MLKDLAVKNRSCRGYDASRAVTRGELLELVDLTRYTASSLNMQPLKYALVYEKEKLEQVYPLLKWAAALKDLRLPLPGTEPQAFIVVCLDMDICHGASGVLRDVGIAAQTILLGAVEMDLGGCMIANFDKEKLKNVLSLPENIEPNLVLAIGKPAEKIVLTEVGEDGSTAYYRDADNTHYVPKRRLEDIIL